MSLKLNTASGGSITLQEADTASNLTLTVPAVSGTMLTNKTAGTVLQVVNATYATPTSSSSSTYTDTGLTATITPTSSSNKILVFVNLSGMFKQSSDTTVGAKLVRNAADILIFEGVGAGNGLTTIESGGTSAVCYLDSPATTSATTYKVQFRSSSNTASVTINTTAGGSAVTTSTITLMEIVG
jgi:hypothetical protein